MDRKRSAATWGAALVVLAIGAAPIIANASDHLDAPALGGVASGSNFAPHSEHGDRDLADLYAFQGRNASNTTLVMTSNPAINLFGGKFGPNVRYIFNVDTNGDAVQDIAYVFRFDNGAEGNQNYMVARYSGARAVSLPDGGMPWGSGSTSDTGIGTLVNGGQVFAGLRSDPFFFDLTGFEGTVFGIGTDRLGNHPTDFFKPLNVNAIVLEISDGELGGHIGVWAQTQYMNNGKWLPADQVGRPAINTVFNNSLVDPNAGTTKNEFNVTPPSQQRTAFNGVFRNDMIATLTNINAALGTGHPDYTPSRAAAIANILLPDLLTYDTSTSASGPLNGRGLADDVIDTELGLTTNGSVTSDGVGAHHDYRSSFPYLGSPH
ncbi:MAG TPA: DUF4331 family protein [Candidatus Limnocylindrales bacterium]|jgi:hypothetical protein